MRRNAGRGVGQMRQHVIDDGPDGLVHGGGRRGDARRRVLGAADQPAPLVGHGREDVGDLRPDGLAAGLAQQCLGRRLDALALRLALRLEVVERVVELLLSPRL